MHITGKIQNIRIQQEAVIKQYRQLSSEYLQYITDKSIPIMERWKVYIDAPSELTYNSSWSIHFNSKALNYIFDKNSMRRGERIYIADMMSVCINDGELHPEEIYTDEDQSITKEQLIEGMEELLKENLEYFTFDW